MVYIAQQFIKLICKECIVIVWQGGRPMEKKTQNSIAKNIKKYRLLNNMTQKELSEKLFLDTQYYAQLERGERNFSIEKIAMICSLFHIGIEDIIELNEVESTSKNDSENIIEDLTNTLHTLNYSQLLVVKKFLDEIVPYVK